MKYQIKLRNGTKFAPHLSRDEAIQCLGILAKMAIRAIMVEAK
jgi:hypothetical protein